MSRHLVPKMFYVVHIKAFRWPIHDFHVLVIQEIPSGVGYVGRSIILNQDPVDLEGETLLQHMCIHLLVHGTIQTNQLTYATMVKSSPYDDRWTDIIICSLHRHIIVPHRTSISVM